MKSLAFALVLAFGAPTLAHAAEPTAPAAPVVALDGWGRYVNAIELDYSSGDKRWKYAPRGLFLFLVEGAAMDDVALATYTFNGKPFGTALKCPVTSDPMPIDATRSVVVVQCKHDLDKVGVDKPGTFGVTLGYRQLAKGVDHADLAQYRFDVKSHEGPGKTTEFHVDHDFRLGEAWTHIKQDGGFELFTWFKVGGDDASRVDIGKLRCTVGGKAFDMAEQTNERWSSAHEDYAKRDAGGSATRVKWAYHAFFATGDAKGFLTANPGEYTCAFTRNGERDRVITFNVADGKVVKPACQAGAAPAVRTPPSTTFVRATLAAPQDAAFDAKAFAAGALLGRAGVQAACGF